MSLFELLQPVVFFARAALLGVVGAAVTYVVVRFGLLGVVRWSTDDDQSSLRRYGVASAKALAFGDALAIGASVLGFDGGNAVLGLSVVFALAWFVYGVEKKWAAGTSAT
ncbi:hypothetical protein [Halorussus salinus]|uniref:hypothetical protein n=1 Tax=Halorussus salinus TaxID=1364935 RepID=UPI0010928406|nr:hypothetical protein [Halorussus salinus]